MEQGNAIQLSVVLFLPAYNRCANGCTAAGEQQGNPQQKIGVISRLRRLVGTGGDGAAGPLRRYGIGLLDFLCCRSVLVILLATGAVPILDIALSGLGRRLCREVPGMAFQSGIKWYINLGKMADYFNGGTTTS